MTNGQLTAILCTAVALVVLVLTYPAIQDAMRPDVPPLGECTVIETSTNPNVAAPYVQTECEES